MSAGAVTVDLSDQIQAVAMVLRGEPELDSHGRLQLDFRGTCFAFRWRHIFLTAGHCLRDLSAADLLIWTLGGKRLRVLEIHRCASADIAALIGDKAEEGAPYPFTGLHEFMKHYGIGAEVAAFGYPRGGTMREPDNVPFPRMLRDFVQLFADFADDPKDSPTYRAFELSFPSLLGISGGPVFVPGSDRVFAMMTGNDLVETTPKGHATPQVISHGMALSLWHVQAWLSEMAPPPGDLRY